MDSDSWIVRKVFSSIHEAGAALHVTKNFTSTCGNWNFIIAGNWKIVQSFAIQRCQCCSSLFSPAALHNPHNNVCRIFRSIWPHQQIRYSLSIWTFALAQLHSPNIQISTSIYVTFTHYNKAIESRDVNGYNCTVYTCSPLPTREARAIW